MNIRNFSGKDQQVVGLYGIRNEKRKVELFNKKTLLNFPTKREH